MDRNNSIQLFEDRKIRTAWDEEQEEWYFSVQDVIAVLAKSSDPKQYIKKMRARNPELSANRGTICTLVQMPAAVAAMPVRYDKILKMIPGIRLLHHRTLHSLML